MSPRPRRRRLKTWAEAKECLSAVRYPTGGGRRAVDFPDIPNLLATPEGCAEMARQILAAGAKMPHRGRRQLALDILENAIDFGFAPPRELLEILKRELATKPTGVTAKHEYQRALEIKRTNPNLSVRALAAEVGVPWPTIARWQRTEYWKIAVSLKWH
jgi:hypothetical protein